MVFLESLIFRLNKRSFPRCSSRRCIVRRLASTLSVLSSSMVHLSWMDRILHFCPFFLISFHQKKWLFDAHENQILGLNVGNSEFVDGIVG